jgi:hypothetical protein
MPMGLTMPMGLPEPMPIILPEPPPTPLNPPTLWLPKPPGLASAESAQTAAARISAAPIETLFNMLNPPSD